MNELIFVSYLFRNLSTGLILLHIALLVDFTTNSVCQLSDKGGPSLSGHFLLSVRQIVSLFFNFTPAGRKL